MEKKKVIIVCITFISIIGMYLIYKSTVNKQPEFESDVAREEYIKDFAKPQGNDLEINVDTNEGGNESLIIDNIGELMKYENVDLMFSAQDQLLNTIKTLPSLYKDIYKLNDSELETYYKNNKDTLIKVLGIEDISHFKTFIKSLEFIKGNEIIKAAIDETTLAKVGNIITFKINLTTKDNEVNNFEIEVMELNKDGKTYGLVLWK